MSTLHTVNKSPFTHTTLGSCLAICADGDAILLLEDGVFGALPSSPYREGLIERLNKGAKIYVLIDDVKARGLSEKLMHDINSIDYAEFVQLSTIHRRVQSWY